MKKQFIISLFLNCIFNSCGTIPNSSENNTEEKKVIEPTITIQYCSSNKDCKDSQSCYIEEEKTTGYCVANCQNNNDCADSCSYCSAQSHMCEPFPEGEKIGECIGEFQQCNGFGTCVCTGNHDGEYCTSCKAGFVGASCTECAAGRTGENCDKCLPGYFGPNCEPCACGSLQCDDGIAGTGSCYKCEGNFTGINCDACLPGFYGANCEACNCEHGTCNEGVSGNGHCSSCEEDYFGIDCKEKESCEHGTASIGISGNGLCSSCEAGYYGANCDLVARCDHGELSDGPNGTGKCASCEANWAGEYCNIEVTCANGTPSTGILGNGRCSSCKTGWAGEDCNDCHKDYYGLFCDKKYGKLIDIEGNEYKTVKIGDDEWMAENLKVTTDNTGNKINQDYWKVVTYAWQDDKDVMYQIYDHHVHNVIPISSLCPNRWHTATKTDYNNLEAFVKENFNSNSFIAALAAKGFYENWPTEDFSFWGTDEFGFNLKPTQLLNQNYYNHYYVNFFVAEGRVLNFAINQLSWSDQHAVDGSYNIVRCVKDRE